MLSVNIEVINIITVSFTADVGFTEVHEPLWVLNSAPPPSIHTRSAAPCDEHHSGSQTLQIGGV